MRSESRLITRLLGPLRPLLALLTLVMAWPLMAQSLVLDHARPSTTIELPLEFLIDDSGQRTVDQIETEPAGQAPRTGFAPVGPKPSFLTGQGALWMRFDVAIKSPAPHWRLTIPMPMLDQATLYFRNPAGQWVRQQAGDTLPMRSWSQHARYPVFDLARDTTDSVRYYLQIRQARTPYSLLPQLVSESEFVESRQNEHLLLGIYFGLALLVVVLALFHALSCRDAAFGIFALHVTLFASTQAVYTGLGGLYAWPEWPALNNAGAVMMTLTSAATALWFARTVCTPRRYAWSLDLLLLALMGLLPLAGVVDLLLSTPASFMALNGLAAAGMLALVVGIGVALVEGDRDTRWVALGFSPILLSALFPLLRNLGVIASGFWTEYGRLLASLLEMPILFYGLRRRISPSRDLSVRTRTLRHMDPLTGLHATRGLLDQLRQSLSTAERHPRPLALLLVNLAGLGSLQKQHGREMADRAMLMAAACMGGIAHPADTVARVGDTQFALLLASPVSLDAANDVATRILARSLRPSHQLAGAEPLRFHIAVGYIAKGAGLAAAQAEASLAQMLQVVNSMNDGSRKAIRQVHL